MQPLVEANGISRLFQTGPELFTALRNMSCSVMSGDRVAILGSSGSGKSTLLHILAGLEQPTSGAVTWPALNPKGASEPRGIAVVFQSASLVPSLTVLENAALPLLLDGQEPRAEAVAREALDVLGLGDLADHPPARKLKVLCSRAFLEVPSRPITHSITHLRSCFNEVCADGAWLVSAATTMLIQSLHR